MPEPLSKIPTGLRYYFGAEARLRRAVEDTAMSVFDGWSYEEISTPTIDYYALFERGMGSDEAHRAFRFMDTDGQLLALRPDVTSSVARSAATLFAEHARPLRLCYAASTFRQQSRSHAEWRRESTQLGCELIGASALEADIETLLIAAEVLERLALPQDAYRITVNSVRIFNGIAENLRLSPDARETMRDLIDLKDAAELERFLKPYVPSQRERENFARLTQLSGKRAVLRQARDVITNRQSIAALDHLESLWRVIETLNHTKVFDIDFGDVSGLDYYTGFIFKIYLTGAGARIGRGGRYDTLTANFGRAEPAVGFVLDLDAITDVLARSTASPFNELARPTNHASTTARTSIDAANVFHEARQKRAAGERVRIIIDSLESGV